MVAQSLLGVAGLTVTSQADQGLLLGGLFVAFVSGLAVGVLMQRRRNLQDGTVQDGATSIHSAGMPMTHLHSASDTFPGALVQLKKREGRWFFILISKGSDQVGVGWERLQAIRGPVLLDQVFEDSEAGVLADVLDTAAKLNLPVNYECRLKTEQSDAYWVSLMLSLDTQSAEPLMNGIIIGIMDRRILEQELFEEKQFAEQVLEHSGVVFSVRDRDTKLIRTNRTFVELGGYTPEEIYFSEGDRHLLGESYDFVMNQFHRILAGEYPLVSENPWLCRDGSKRVLRWTNTGLMNSAGQVSHIISVGVDITDLRTLEERLNEKIHEYEVLFDNCLMVERALLRSETRFRTIFDKMASGLALINEEGYYEEVNDSWCRITGYSREEARKLKVLDITHEDDRASARDAMKGFLDSTLDMDRMEKRYVKKDGSVLWVDLTASKIDPQEETGEITLVSIINDITDRKAIEDKMKVMNRRLEVEKNRVQILADHRMAVIELFDTFRNSQSIEDLQRILKNNLPRFVKYRDLMVALRISRLNPGYVVKDLLDETPEADLKALIREGRGIIGSVMQSRTVYLSNDVRLDPVFTPHHPEVKSYLALPIVYKDFLWGVIGLDHFDADHFTSQDIGILTIVGTLIAMQMEEMTAKSALHQESDRLRMLHDLVQEMAQARNNQDILRKICSGGLFSEIHIYTTAPTGLVNPCACFSCSESGLWIPDQISEITRDRHMMWEDEGAQAKYNLARPIWYKQVMMGVIRVCSELPFTDPEIELVSILSEQTGVFWELNNLIGQREREAMIDPLTAVWNRRYMIARLEQEDERIFRYGGKACVAILDMGDFKLINDQYGHVKGDEVLVAAARLIEKGLRKTDYVGRFGGDEFIVFLPNTELREAEMLFEKIRAGVSSLAIDGINRIIEIDCGIAVVPGDDSSLLGAVRTADERMYFNKRERKRKSLISN